MRFVLSRFLKNVSCDDGEMIALSFCTRKLENCVISVTNYIFFFVDQCDSLGSRTFFFILLISLLLLTFLPLIFSSFFLFFFNEENNLANVKF